MGSTIGGFGNDLISGESGNDTLDGGAGRDIMAGGAGDDLFKVNSASDIVLEGADAGTDTVESSISYTLGENLENLTLAGDAVINGYGNTLNNILTGNSGVNCLGGGDGNDTMSGGAGNDYLFGDAGVDILNGGLGNDLLSGGVGNDTMSGGTGNDIYVVDSADDAVAEEIDEGTDTVRSSVSYSLGWNLENLTLITGAGLIDGTGNELNNILVGNSAANMLDGSDGNDVLDGGLDNDSMTGGLGDDTFIVDAAGDILAEGFGQGMDTVQSSISYTLRDDFENLTFTGSAAINGTGNGLDNTLIGNGAANILDGGAGNDILQGGLGNDTLRGGAGNDTLDGGLGSDKMSGGADDDTYRVSAATDSITEDLNAGTDTVESEITYTLGANLDNLTLLGTAANGTGNNLNNILVGNAAANTLSGLVGVDSMFGGTGNDIYIVDSSSDEVTEALNEGTDTVQSSVGFALGANLENLTLTGTLAGNGTGNNADNILLGNSGANVLDGGLGNDALTGGLGNDTYKVDAAGDVVTEAASAGTDTVESEITYVLGANIENLILSGIDNIDGSGNTLNNILTGNSGNNILIGLAGNDTLDGGAGDDDLQGGLGNDTYIVDSGDTVTEGLSAGTDTVQSSLEFTLGANLENLTLTGTNDINGTGNALNNNLTGNSGTNFLTGLAGNDTLRGWAGNDTLDGGLGSDKMSGGADDDTYRVSAATDSITEDLNAGTDTVESEITYTLGANLDNLTLLGTATNGTGNTLNNFLIGNSLANTLSGLGGSDTMSGGAGNDIYTVDAPGDEVTEDLAEGTDTVQSSVGFTLGDNLENLTLTGTLASNGTGNDDENILLGNSGANVLDGGLGDDTLTGGLGNDTYIVDAAGDVVTEAANAGTDTVESEITYTLGLNLENLTLSGADDINGTGNTLNNILTGNSGNNILTGLAGNDILDGGAGDDDLQGGLGNDTYVVDSPGDTVTELAGVGTGTDTVRSVLLSYILGANLENLILAGTGDIDGTGNTLNNNLTGNDGANFLFGDAGNDTLIGGLGNDTLDGGTGTDNMIGGLGDDTYCINATTDIVTENANAGTDTVESEVTYTLKANFEKLVLTGAAVINGTGNTLNNNLTGNSDKNILAGGTGNDTLAGEGGNDTLKGDAGNDTLHGGVGNDVLTGGTGNDTFVFDTALDDSTNKDSITDFTHGQDKVVLDNSIFAQLTEGLLGSANFNATGVAADADDYIIYNTATGALFFDADGSGGTDAAIQFATLTTKPAITANDFMIVS